MSAIQSGVYRLGRDAELRRTNSRRGCLRLEPGLRTTARKMQTANRLPPGSRPRCGVKRAETRKPVPRPRARRSSRCCPTFAWSTSTRQTARPASRSRHGSTVSTLSRGNVMQAKPRSPGPSKVQRLRQHGRSSGQHRCQRGPGLTIWTMTYPSKRK